MASGKRDMPPSRQTAPPSWSVSLNAKARKGQERLPTSLHPVLQALIGTLQKTGRAKGWPHYGLLRQCGPDVHHCHLHHGRPTYVIIWRISDKAAKDILITYIGTHEKAPY